MPRTFIAIELPENVRLSLMQTMDELKPRLPAGSVRWVRPEGIHLTLNFLGEVPDAKIQALLEGLPGVVAQHTVFPIKIEGFGCFPSKRRPRVLWVGVEDPTSTLIRAQLKISAFLGTLGFPRERRPFHPHLTLGRVRQGKGDRTDLTEALAAVNIGQLGNIVVERVSLIKSDLTPRGAMYTLLDAFPLAQGAT